jgi:hypothetical protein
MVASIITKTFLIMVRSIIKFNQGEVSIIKLLLWLEGEVTHQGV